MAIIAENEYGWIICCEKYFNKIYKMCMDEQSVIHRLKIRDAFFDIQTPFYTNSKSEKLAKMNNLKDLTKAKKRAKAKTKISKIQTQDLERLNFISKGTNELITLAIQLKHLENSEITSEEWFKNNSKARTAALEIMNHSDASLGIGSDVTCTTYSSLPFIRKLGDDKYILPPQSSFYLCDIANFFKSGDKKYDLILLDPPWINKSVRRKKSYYSLKYEFLNNMPIEKFTNPGCLIVVWITNSSASASFVLNELFPKCNVTATSTWHWCKITKKGSFIHPIDSHHKKPYENLILGRVCYGNDAAKEDTGRPEKEIDSTKLIISVPSSIHSHKPPLIEILKPYIKPEPCCLELFARYLLPGWKSVGNEVLKLQNVKLFDIVQD